MNKTVRNMALVFSLVAVAAAGCSSRAKDQGQALDPIEQIIVLADADPDIGEAPLTVELFCDPLEEIEEPRYSWDPGDGSDRLSGQRVQHTYRRPGVYQARVVVTDAQGNRGEDEIRIDVEEPAQ